MKEKCSQEENQQSDAEINIGLDTDAGMEENNEKASYSFIQSIATEFLLKVKVYK